MTKKKFFIPEKYIPYLKNRYFLTALGFLVWLSFFDRNDFITTWSYHSKLESLLTEKAYYEEEVKKYTNDLNLMSDHNNLEKYGREKYYMKKDNEDVYVIVDETKKIN